MPESRDVQNAGTRLRDRPSILEFLRANLARALVSGAAALLSAIVYLAWQSCWQYKAEISLSSSEVSAPLFWIKENGADLPPPLQGAKAILTADGFKITSFGPTAHGALQTARNAASEVIAFERERIFRALAEEIGGIDTRMIALRSGMNREAALSSSEAAYGNADKLLEIRQLEQRRSSLAENPLLGGSALVLTASGVGPANLVAAAPFRFLLVTTLTIALLSLAITALPHFRRPGILSVGELGRHTGLDVLGSLPEARRKQRNLLSLVMYSPASQLSDALRVLRARIVPRKGPWRSEVLMLTSSVSGEGTSTTSLLLAETLANWGKRVLLIDADTRTRTLTKVVNAEEGPGLLSLLAGICSLQDVVFEPDGLSVHVLPAEDASAHAADILATTRLPEFLDWARKNYDHVLIDCPPARDGPDATAIAPFADRILYHVRWGKTAKAAIEDGLSALKTAGAVSPGMVFTRVEVRKLERLGYAAGHGSLLPT